MADLVRVVRGGGEIKIMLYNRRSIFVFNRWVKHALLRGQPWRSLRWVLWNRCESVGTKGYTRKELISMLAALPLDRIQVHTECTSADYLSASAFPPLNWFYRCILKMAGPQFAWKPAHYTSRVNDLDQTARLTDGPAVQHPPDEVLLTGYPLGFFHCITARKRI